MNLHTSMSVSPDSHSIIPSNMFQPNLSSKNKSRLSSRIGGKINKKNLYIKMKNVDIKDCKRNKISSRSIKPSSVKELNRVNSLLHKLKEVTRAKENLAIDNKTLKFKLAELQKEKCSLSKLTKKLNKDSKLSKSDTDFIVLNKKEYEEFKKRY